MRDPRRIKEFCDALAEIWERECPDWRFGQLIENVYRVNNITMPFFVEDEIMLDCIKGTFNTCKNRG